MCSGASWPTGGAGGSLGAQEVVRAAPDGGTLLTTTSSIAILPALHPNLGFDPERDLTPVAASAAVMRLDGPARLAARMREDVAKWKTVGARAGIRAE